MTNRDRIEFYSNKGMEAAVESSMTPRIHDTVSIRGETWKVVDMSFALDYSDDPVQRGMRCNVHLEKV